MLSLDPIAARSFEIGVNGSITQASLHDSGTNRCADGPGGLVIKLQPFAPLPMAQTQYLVRVAPKSSVDPCPADVPFCDPASVSTTSFAIGPNVVSPSPSGSASALPSPTVASSGSATASELASASTSASEPASASPPQASPTMTPVAPSSASPAPRPTTRPTRTPAPTQAPAPANNGGTSGGGTTGGGVVLPEPHPHVDAVCPAIRSLHLQAERGRHTDRVQDAGAACEPGSGSGGSGTYDGGPTRPPQPGSTVLVFLPTSAPSPGPWPVPSPVARPAVNHRPPRLRRRRSPHRPSHPLPVGPRRRPQNPVPLMRPRCRRSLPAATSRRAARPRRVAQLPCHRRHRPRIRSRRRMSDSPRPPIAPLASWRSCFRAGCHRGGLGSPSASANATKAPHQADRPALRGGHPAVTTQALRRSARGRPRRRDRRWAGRPRVPRRRRPTPSRRTARIPTGPVRRRRL